MTVDGGRGDRGVRRPAAVRPRAGAGDPRRRRARRAGGHPAAGRAAAAAGGRLPAGRRAGRRRRGSPGTTARSAARRPASSRCAPATARGCSTGSPPRSPARASTSPRPGSRPSAPTPSTASTCATPRARRSTPEQRRRVEAALAAATGGAVPEPCTPAAPSARHAGLRSPVLSVVRATVGSDRDGTVPPSREGAARGQPHVALPRLRRRHREFVQPPCADGHTDDGGECPEWACADCGTAAA